MMKRIIPFLLIVVLFSSANAAGTIKGAELITPSSALIYGKTSSIKKLLATAHYVVNEILAENQKVEFLKEIDKVKTKTGIDLLNGASLTQNGIDLSRPLSVAYFEDRDSKKESVLIFIPVLDPKKFPLRFVEIVKSLSNPDEERDLEPAITSYKKHTIYQINRVFTTSIDKYFVLAPKGELIREAIDLQSDKKKSLAYNEAYRNYLSKDLANKTVNIFFKKEFLVGVFQKLFNSVMKSNSSASNYDGPTLQAVQYSSTQNGAGQTGPESTQLFGTLDYAALGLGFEDGRFKLNASVNFNKKDADIGVLLNVLHTGKTGEGIIFSRASLYAYMAVNLNALETKEGRSSSLYRDYTKFKEEFSKDLNIDFDKDFLPNFEGVVNGVVSNPTEQGSSGDFAIHVPMKNAQQTKKFYLKFREFLKKKHAANGGFNDEKVKGAQACSFLDAKGVATYLYVKKTGIYLGNNLSLIESVAKAKKIDKVSEKVELIKKMNDKVFLMIYLKKNTFLSSLLKMQMQRERDLAGVAQRVGDIYLSGERQDRCLSFDLDVEILKKVQK